MKSDNQILKSYMVLYFLPDSYDYQQHLDGNEENWFLNYHIILKLCKKEEYPSYINKYLIPEQERKGFECGKASKKAEIYHAFYLYNLNAKIPFIKDMKSVSKDVEEYLKNKVAEREYLSDNYIDLDFGD